MLSTRLTGIIDEHHGGVEPQGAVHARLGAVAREVLGDKSLARIVGGAVWSATLRLRREAGGDDRLVGGLVSVEERLPVAGHRAFERHGVGLAHRGIPVVSRKDLVGALAGLHDLDVLGHLLGQQVERDAVVADHRLAHGADRAVEGGEHALGADADLMVVGVEPLGDEVGVLELVALDPADGLEADRERRQTVLTRLGEQPDDQAGIHAA